MKLFTAAQIRAWDQFTIAHEPISSVELMNRAASVFTDWLCRQYAPSTPMIIVCGTGNNGGDGLVTARYLQLLNWPVSVILCDFTKKHSPDFDYQWAELLKYKVPTTVLKNTQNLPKIPLEALVIDAIFGSGLSRAPEGDFATVIQYLNQIPNEIVAIDLPSGLFTETATTGICVEATRTFSFEIPKTAFLFPENVQKVGDWHIESIGLHPEYEAATASNFYYFTTKDARERLHKRNKYDHKGTFGHALLICGSLGKMGAAVLSARACLRSGVGLLTVHVPKCGLDILQISAPEAMCTIDPASDCWTEVPELDKYTTIGIGCGIGTAPNTALALKRLLQSVTRPVVLDADALNILAKNPDWWELVPQNSILTPHPKEFERLFGPTLNHFSRNALQREMAIKYGVYILLKGANSAIAGPEGNCWFNSTGNPGMATGGSGDVLTGIITGLLAQGYTSENAVLLGVYLHGKAGDIAAQKRSQEAITAGDIIEFIYA